MTGLTFLVQSSTPTVLPVHSGLLEPGLKGVEGVRAEGQCIHPRPFSVRFSAV